MPRLSLLAKFRLWWLKAQEAEGSVPFCISPILAAFIFPSEVSVFPEAEGRLTPSDTQQDSGGSCWEVWWQLSSLSCRRNLSPPWHTALSELPLEIPHLAARCSGAVRLSGWMCISAPLQSLSSFSSKSPKILLTGRWWPSAFHAYFSPWFHFLSLESKNREFAPL